MLVLRWKVNRKGGAVNYSIWPLTICTSYCVARPPSRQVVLRFQWGSQATPQLNNNTGVSDQSSSNMCTRHCGFALAAKNGTKTSSSRTEQGDKSTISSTTIDIHAIYFTILVTFFFFSIFFLFFDFSFTKTWNTRYALIMQPWRGSIQHFMLRDWKKLFKFFKRKFEKKKNRKQRVTNNVKSTVQCQ